MEILLVLQIIVVVALVAIILVQKTSSDGFTGGSSPNSFLTGRASANLFTRTTSVLAAIFIINSLVLAYMASHTERGDSILDKAVEEVNQEKSKNPESKPADNLGDLQKKLDNNVKPESKEATPSSEKPAEEKPVEQKKSAPAVPVSE